MPRASEPRENGIVRENETRWKKRHRVSFFAWSLTKKKKKEKEKNGSAKIGYQTSDTIAGLIPQRGIVDQR